MNCPLHAYQTAVHPNLPHIVDNDNHTIVKLRSLRVGCTVRVDIAIAISSTRRSHKYFS